LGIRYDWAFIFIDHGKHLATTVDSLIITSISLVISTKSTKPPCEASCGLTSAAMVYLIFSSSGASSLGASPLALGATDEAQIYVADLFAQQDEEGLGLKVDIEKAGTPAAAVTFNFCYEKDLGKTGRFAFGIGCSDSEFFA
jgi:hypothetical protein